MDEIIRLGIEQGVFSTSVNYPLQMTLVKVQLEALKRMEELLPEGLTIGDAYAGITRSLLRSIGTQKGLEILLNLEKQQSKE